MSDMADGPDDGWQTVTNPQEAAAAAKAGAGTAAGPVRLQGPDLLTTMDPGLAAQVKAIGSYDMPLPPSSRGNGAAIQQAVAQVYPNYDYVNAPTKLAARKAFLVGKQGQNVTVINTVLGHIGEYARAVDDLGNTDYPAVNSVENSVLPAVGDTGRAAKLKRVQLARQAVADDLASAFKGGGAGDVHNEKAFGAIFDANDSLPAARQSVQTAGNLLYSRINAQAESYKRAMGTAEDPFTLLGPHAREALDQVTSSDYLKNGVGELKAPLFAAPGQNGTSGSNPPPNAPTVSGGPGPDGGAGGGGSTPPASPPPPPATTLSSDGSSDVITAKERAFNAEANGLFATPGSTRADFDALAAKYGRAAYGGSLDAAIKYRNAGGKGAKILPAVEHTGPSTAGVIANSGVGSAAVSLSNTGTFGLLPKAIGGINAVKDKLTGDDPRSLSDIYANDLADAHANIDASQAAHPMAALGGSMAGFMLGDGALSAIPGVAKLAGKIPALLRPVVGDAIVGGTYGLGSSDHLADLPANVLSGAALSAAGGTVGRGVLKGVGALASPALSGAGRRLIDEGITLTPGQIAGASGTKVGDFIKTAEDKATSIPIIGDAINMARRGGIEDFNRAAGNKVLSSIDQTLPSDVKAGHPMVEHLQNAVSDAYDKALVPLRAPADAQLGTDFASVKANVRPDQQDAFAKVLTDVVAPHLPTGTDPMTGPQLQMIKRGLNEKIGQYKGDANGADLAGDLEDLRDSFMQFAERADPKSAAAYRAADAANAKLKRVETAASGTKDGVFSPQQFRSAVGRRGYGTTTANLAAGNAPLQDLATDASTILPSTVPDSGTGGRLLYNQAVRHIVPAALGGGIGELGDGHQGALVGAALGAGVYSKMGLRMAQGLVAGSRNSAGSKVAGSALLGLGGAALGYQAGGTTGAVVGGGLGIAGGRRLNTLGAVLRRNAALGGAAGAPAALRMKQYQ